LKAGVLCQIFTTAAIEITDINVFWHSIFSKQLKNTWLIGQEPEKTQTPPSYTCCCDCDTKLDTLHEDIAISRNTDL